MKPDRVWTNSIVARVAGTGCAVYFAVTPWGEPSASAGRAVVGDVFAVVLAMVLLGAVWTPRLVVADGVVTSRNFFITTSVPLRDVVAVSPVWFLGLWIRRKRGLGIPTLVAFAPMRGSIVRSRASRIAVDLVALANLARTGGEIPPQQSKPPRYPAGLHRRP